jgi:ankyrin repeat protein
LIEDGAQHGVEKVMQAAKKEIKKGLIPSYPRRGSIAQAEKIKKHGREGALQQVKGRRGSSIPHPYESWRANTNFQGAEKPAREIKKWLMPAELQAARLMRQCEWRRQPVPKMDLQSAWIAGLIAPPPGVVMAAASDSSSSDSDSEGSCPEVQESKVARKASTKWEGEQQQRLIEEAPKAMAHMPSLDDGGDDPDELIKGEQILVLRFIDDENQSAEEVSRNAAANIAQGMFRRAKASLLFFDIVQSMFEKQYDPSTGTHYYYDHVNMMSRWTPPPGCGESLAARTLFSTTEEHYAIVMQQAWRKKAALMARMERMGDLWEKQFDHRRRQYYYVNSITGMTQDEKPIGFFSQDALTPRSKTSRQLERDMKRSEAAQQKMMKRKMNAMWLEKSKGGAKELVRQLAALREQQSKEVEEEIIIFWERLLGGTVSPVKVVQRKIDPETGKLMLSNAGEDEDEEDEEKKIGPEQERLTILSMEMLKARPSLAAQVKTGAYPLHYLARSASVQIDVLIAAINAYPGAAKHFDPRNGCLPVHNMCGCPKVNELMLQVYIHSTVLVYYIPLPLLLTLLMPLLLPLLLLLPPSLTQHASTQYTSSPSPPLLSPTLSHLLSSLSLQTVIEAYPDGIWMSERYGGRYPLHIICQNPHATKALIEYLYTTWPEGIKTPCLVTRSRVPAAEMIKRTRDHGCLPLHLIVKNPCMTIELFDMLYKKYIPAAQMGTRGGNILHFICANKKALTPNALRHLIEVHPLNAKWKEEVSGKSPLHILCRNPKCQRDVLMILIAAAPECAGECRGGYSCLQIVCANPSFKLDSLETILEAAPATIHLDTHCDSPLFLICANPAIDSRTLNHLLFLRPNSAFFAREGETALHKLVSNPEHTLYMVKALLDRNPEAARSALRTSGEYALHRACANPGVDAQVLEMLITSNTGACGVATKGRSTGRRGGKYPLHYLLNNLSALRSQEAMQIVRPLLEAFPQALLKEDTQGKTPLDYFERVCRLESSTDPVEQKIISSSRFDFQAVLEQLVYHHVGNVRKENTALKGRKRTSVARIELDHLRVLQREKTEEAKKSGGVLMKRF